MLRRRHGVVILGLLLAIGAVVVWQPATVPPPRSRIPARGSVPSPQVAANRGGAASAESRPRTHSAGTSENVGDSMTVRVTLTAGPEDRLQISCDSGYVIRDAVSKRVHQRGRRLAPVDVTAVEGGIAMGASHFRSDAVDLIADAPPAIWVGRHQYQGFLRIHRSADGRVRPVNHVRMSHYLESVLDSEMPASFPDAARRAQAVVARTYAVSHCKGHPQFDVFCTSRSQNYLGHLYLDDHDRPLAGAGAASRRMVNETAGTVCAYQGDLFCTYYSAACGGGTIDGTLLFSDAAPPLKGVVCPWCADAPRFRWSRHVSRDDAARRFRRYFASRGHPFGGLANWERQTGSTDGQSPWFRVSDGEREYRVSSAILRSKIFSDRIPSARFHVEQEGDAYALRGTGRGHGVGLCQWGARGLALAGRTWREIIAHYYPGAELIQHADQSLRRGRGAPPSERGSDGAMR